MGLTDLPQEILIMIVQRLDTKSIYNLFDTCTLLKNIISLTGVVKEYHMSMNTLASVTSLKTDFFKVIAPNLVELNLCGVPDVRKTYLMPAMKKMKNLQILDVSFTNLNLTDFLDIYGLCPTIINVSLNFMINKSGLSKMSDDSIVECQEMFKNFQHVHFVGSATNLLYSRLPFLLLQDANLDSLKYTIAESDRLHTIYVPEKAEASDMVKFKQFFLCFLDWTTIYAFFGSFFMLPVLSMLDLNTIEAIIIIKQNFKQYCIYATPIFQNFFQENFDVAADKIYITEYKDAIIGNAAIMIWDKASNEFDDYFFVKLNKILKPFFPCDCQLYSQESVPERYDWFFITPEPADRAENNCERPPLPTEFRRKRTAPSLNVLNYDQLFKNKRKVQLSLIFDEYLRNPIALPTNCDYLEKLTFLSMSGPVRMKADFFTVLFKSCVNLVTLNIEAPSIYPCAAPISRTIHLSPGLKNLRLLDKGIDFRSLFPSLAKCKTLENVHVQDVTIGEIGDIGEPSILIEECPNLYSLYIQAPLSESTRIRKTQILHNAKMSCNKHHLNLVLHVKSDTHRIFYSYDPFLGIFNLHPIKHIII